MGEIKGTRGKKESTDWGLGCTELLGNWERTFRGSLFLKWETGMWECYLQEDVIILISLYKPFIFMNFEGCVR